jgi:hypothetical protein
MRLHPLQIAGKAQKEGIEVRNTAADHERSIITAFALRFNCTSHGPVSAQWA